jgi:hypothetical protein
MRRSSGAANSRPINIAAEKAAAMAAAEGRDSPCTRSSTSGAQSNVQYSSAMTQNNVAQ